MLTLDALSGMAERRPRMPASTTTMTPPSGRRPTGRRVATAIALATLLGIAVGLSA